jgi:hypothetical protein
MNEIKPINSEFKGIPGCKKCGGSGFKVKKQNKTKDITVNSEPVKSTQSSVVKQKPCSSCMKGSGTCPKCNGTGKKLKSGKECKCKAKLAKKADKAKNIDKGVSKDKPIESKNEEIKNLTKV